MTAAAAAAALALAACGDPPPTCAATDSAYSVCSDDQVWECQVATQAQIDAKKAIDAACQQQADPVKCMLDAKYEMFPMKLKANCKAGGQVCVATTPPAARTASCKVP